MSKRTNSSKHAVHVYIRKGELCFGWGNHTSNSIFEKLLFTVIRLKIIWQHDEKTGEQKFPVFPSVVMYSSFKGHLFCPFLQDVI